MKLTAPIALNLASTALAQNSTFTTSTTAAPSTTIVSTLTTICGSATVLMQNGNYYTCTEAMTLTITDCPCTMTHPFSITTYAAAPTTTASTTTITASACCPSIAPTSAQNPAQGGQAGYAPSCQAAGAAGAAACYTLSIGTAMLPSSTHGYLYTNGAGVVSFGKAAAVALVGSVAFCALLM